jgi:hypothetical protein
MSQLTPTASPITDELPTVELRPIARNREEALRVNVLNVLGRPSAFLRTAVVPLWSDHFRVNVYTGSSEAGVAIPNSYFVTADAAGTILQAAPPIIRQY